MAVYSVEFSALSVLTKIPDAQTIFGAFCYKYKELFGNEELERFLEIENSNKPIVLFSSMFYKNVLPLPQDFRPVYRVGMSLEETQKNKKIKKIKYISKNLFKEYIKNKEKFENDFYENLNGTYKIINGEILAKKDDDILDEDYYKVDYRTRNSNPLSEDKKLFRDEIMYFNNKLTFMVYIEILKEEWTSKIKQVFEKMNYVFFGGFKSIGYNMYRYVNIQEEMFDKKYNMLISKTLIDPQIDLDASYYSLEIINNKFNLQGTKNYRKQVVVLKEGSVVKTNSEILGNLVEDYQDGVLTYQYYLGMLI